MLSRLGIPKTVDIPLVMLKYGVSKGVVNTAAVEQKGDLVVVVFARRWKMYTHLLEGKEQLKL